MSDKRISVIIPARNEAESLSSVLAELSTVDLIHEVLVVDGHSTDGTPDMVRGLGYKVIPQDGIGYGRAVETGLRHATSELVVFLDADGSYDPAALPRLLAALDAGQHDVVFCSRYLPEAGSDDDTWIRALGNYFFTRLLNWLFGVRLSDSLFLYCLGRREMFQHLRMTSRHFEWCIELPIRVAAAGFSYSEIPSRERPRIAGVSKVNAAWDGLKILWFLITLKLGGMKLLPGARERASRAE
jgi:glycosyltransferase involved in cell wall biosynthesis